MPDRDLVRKDRQSSPAASPRGTNYLLAIAINDYQHCSKLNNAVRDVEAFIGLLTTRYHIEPEHVTFIKDSQANKKNIERAFLHLIKTVTPQDNLIVYFSGHGRYDEHFGGNWVPVEAGTSDNDWTDYLSNDLVKTYLARIKSFHTFLIADSCFSGAFFTERNKEKNLASRVDTEPSRWGLTSGKKEIVSDGQSGKHSPFATALLDVLTKATEPPSVMQICTLVLEKVAANALQTPMGSALAVPGHQGGQMVLYFREDEEADWQSMKDNAAGVEQYLAKYPHGKYVVLAKGLESAYWILEAQEREEKAWQQAKAAGVKYALLDFERDFPNSTPVLSGELNRLLASMEEEELWLEATQSNTVSAYRMYLFRSVQKKHALEATEAIKAISDKEREPMAWHQAKQLNTVTAFEAYLRDYPQGIYSAEADRALKQLRGKVVKEQPVGPPKTEEVIKEPFRPEPGGHTKENEPAPNSKMRWVVASIIGFVLVLIVGNKVIGLFSKGDEKPGIQLSKETMAKFSYPMILIPAGEFQMGSDYWGKDGRPVHEVSLSYFYLGKTEVTQEQWRAVMGSDPPELNFKGCDQCPVESVSWDDAQEFIKKLNAKTGEKYRLPTEAEWEYAARGGGKQTYTYAGGNKLDEVAWNGSNADSKTHPVGQKKANELGLYDMSGNVWEWCQDWYAEDYYAKSPSSNPPGPTTGSNRVIRGGSWLFNPAVVSVAYRYVGTPDLRRDNIGFRLARQQ